MCEARHDRAGVFFRARDKGELEVAQLSVEMVDRVADIKLEVGRDLVIPRAGGVQSAGRRADQVGKPRFHIHVDVFEVATKLEPSAFDLGQHGIETCDDFIGVFP